MSEPDIKPTRSRRVRNWLRAVFITWPYRVLWGYYIYRTPPWLITCVTVAFAAGYAYHHAYDTGRRHEREVTIMKKHVAEHKALLTENAQNNALIENCELTLYECRHDMRKHLAAVVGVLGCDPTSGIVLLEKETSK